MDISLVYSHLESNYIVKQKKNRRISFWFEKICEIHIRFRYSYTTLKSYIISFFVLTQITGHLHLTDNLLN